MTFGAVHSLCFLLIMHSFELWHKLPCGSVTVCNLVYLELYPHEMLLQNFINIIAKIRKKSMEVNASRNLANKTELHLDLKILSLSWILPLFPMEIGQSLLLQIASILPFCLYTFFLFLWLFHVLFSNFPPQLLRLKVWDSLRVIRLLNRLLRRFFNSVTGIRGVYEDDGFCTNGARGHAVGNSTRESNSQILMGEVMVGCDDEPWHC